MMKLENSLAVIRFRVNQYCGFPVVSDLIFRWTKQKRNTLQEFKFALLSLCFGLVETQVRYGGIYLEEFEPAQILIKIDGS